MESSGNLDQFNLEGDDDDDLNDDLFGSGNFSFNGRLVISGEPIIFPLLGRGGKLNHTQLACIFKLMHTLNLYSTAC